MERNRIGRASAAQRVRHPALLLIVLLLLPAAAPGSESRPQPAPTSLESVMALLAGSGGVRARFRESKHLALLEAPLESEGMLFFDPPDRLARHTTSPAASSLVVSGDRVLMRDATGEQQVTLGGSEVARSLVESFLVVLQGDLERLRGRYEVEFEAQRDAWHLRLVPRSRRFRQLVQSLEIDGQGAAVKRIEMAESGGDRTVTEFTQVETGHVFTAEESAEVFLADGPSQAR